MIAKVFSAALAAGALAASIAFVLQVLLTVPLIRQAEAYEQAARPHAALSLIHLAHSEHGAGAHATASAAAEWQPGEGLPRLALTGVATLASAVGYALVLLALMLAAGAQPTLPRGLAWGIGGFAAVSLAPAVGLPPELPGMGGEGVAGRQLWWLGAALGAGVGLYLIAVVRGRLAAVLGLAAISAPHLLGAPHGGEGGTVPAALAAQFAARSIALSAVFWATLGLTLGWAWTRLDAAEPGRIAA